jgi:hypothetical protein
LIEFDVASKGFSVASMWPQCGLDVASMWLLLKPEEIDGGSLWVKFLEKPRPMIAATLNG